jgi:hypothetical protein
MRFEHGTSRVWSSSVKHPTTTFGLFPCTRTPYIQSVLSNHLKTLHVRRSLTMTVNLWHNFKFRNRIMVQKRRATAQVVSDRFLIAEARFRTQASPCGICGGRRRTGTCFFSTVFRFPLSIQTHSRSTLLMYHIGRGRGLDRGPVRDRAIQL